MEYLQQAGLDSNPWEHQVLYDVFEPHAREYDPSFSTEERRAYLRRLVGRLFARLNVRGDNARPDRHAEEIWRLLGPASLAVYPEVPAVLRSLRKAGLKIAVTSNWQCGLAHFCVEMGIGRLIDEVVASAEVGAAKPDPAIFAETCRRLGTPSDKVLHVGDTLEDDLEGAEGAGLQGLLIWRGRMGEEPAVRYVHSLEAVLEVLGLQASA